MARSKFFPNVYTPTDEIKALRASSVSEDLAITVPKSNYLGNLKTPKTEYVEILNFLNNHFILPALTLSPGEMNPEWLSEFWYTCTHSVINGTSQIQGFIDNGAKKITVTAGIIRTILQLPVHAVYEPLPDGDTAKGGIVNLTGIECKSSVDANGNRKYFTVHKTKMDGVWNVLFSNFIQCLGTKTGSYDQFSTLEAQISWSLVNSLRVDYASVIFDELVNKVAEPSRAKYVPYSRFLSLIFKDQFEEYDRVPFKGFEPTLVGSQIFSKPATVSLPEFMKTKGILAPQPVTTVQPSDAAPHRPRH